MNPVSNLTTSFILLAIGLTILWLAATNRLSNFLNAWNDLAKPVPGQGTVSTSDTVGQTGADLGSQAGQWIKNQAGQWIKQQIGAGIPGATPPLADPNTPASPTSFALEAGGGTSYRLAQLPSLGTITTH